LDGKIIRGFIHIVNFSIPRLNHLSGGWGQVDYSLYREITLTGIIYPVLVGNYSNFIIIIFGG